MATEMPGVSSCGGAVPRGRAANGATPLRNAAEYGTPETVTTLLDAGANPKTWTEDGEAPPDVAKRNDRLTGTKACWRLYDTRFR